MSAQKIEDFFNEMIKLDPEHDDTDAGLPGLSGSSGLPGSSGIVEATSPSDPLGTTSLDPNSPISINQMKAIRGQLPPDLLEKKKRRLLQKYKEKRQYKRHLPYRGLRCNMGQIHDMSISGIRLETNTDRTHQPTQKLELKFTFDADKRQQDYFIQGEIMWVTITWDHRQHLGVKFDTIADVFQLPIPILKHLGVPQDKLSEEHLQSMRMKFRREKRVSKTNSWLKVMEGLCPEDEEG